MAPFVDAASKLPSMTGAAASNLFTAELGLLTKLTAPRISAAKEEGSMPAPRPIKDAPGRKRQAVPPLNDQEVAMGEVQTLPTHGKLQLGVSSTNHSGMKEMLISRKSRHEDAIEAYKKRNGTMEVELEARTAHVARSFKQLMALNDAELKTMFDELADDFLLQMELSEMEGAWTRISEELSRRATWVDQFERDLAKVEGERREMVEAELTKLLETLVATAHLLPPQLERLVETETHSVNLLILSNREAHADLLARLRIEDVKLHKRSRADWEARLAAWRRLRHDHALKTFRSYLHSPEVIAPMAQQELLQELAASQARFHERRVALLLDTLPQLQPPELTEAAAGQVRAALESLNDDESASATAAMDALAKVESTVAAEVKGAADYLNFRLHHFAAYPVETLEAVVAAQVVPLTELRAEQAADLLERIDMAEQQQRLRLHEEALELTSRFEGSGRILDEHVRRTTELYATLRNDLASARAEHEAADKADENALEAALTAMRRAADKGELQVRREEAMELLSKIGYAYRDFHSLSVDIAEAHPHKMLTELNTLKIDLVDFHHLKLEEVEEEGEEGEEGEEEDEEGDGAEAAAEGGAPAAEEGAPAEEAAPAAAALEITKPLEGEEDLMATFGLVFDEKMAAAVALDDELAGLEAANRIVEPPNPYMLTTGNGARYRMMPDEEVEEEAARRKAAEERAQLEAAAEAGDEAAIAALAEAKAEEEAKAAAAAAPAPAEADAEADPPPPPPPPLTAVELASQLVPLTYAGQAALVPLVHPEDLAKRVHLACCCLSYHEKHQVAIAARASKEAATLDAQLTRELDERLMAHRPRAGQVETDMAAQRDMELLQHRERFVRHVKTLTQRRVAMAANLETELQACQKEEGGHMHKLATLKTALTSEKNNHSSTLNRLAREAAALHATYSAAMADAYARLTALAHNTKKDVKKINAEFADTWKLFSAGGIFNDDERDRFGERLAKVDEEAGAEAESQSARLGSLRDEQLTRANEALEDFQAAFAINLEDIQHIEQIKMQQGKCTADVRIVLAESAAQEAAIEGETSKLQQLVSVTRSREGGAEAVRGVAKAILEATGVMRSKLLHRAQFLDIIASQAMPTTAPRIGLDPPSEATEDAEDDASPMPMASLVEGAYEKHEALMMGYVEEYHDKRGSRAITRPSIIPDDVEAHKTKLQTTLKNLVAKAEADRLSSVKALRKQLLFIWRAFNLVGSSVFDNLAAACRADAAAACQELEVAHQPLAKDRARKREMHELALKPTLRNAGAQSELKALAQAEADRSASVVAAAEELKANMLSVETEQAELLVSRLVHLSTLLLTLFDASIATDDLVPDDEPPEDVHYGMKKKLRIETREMLLGASQDEPKEGRPYGTHVWPGLPLGELTAEKCSAALPSAQDGGAEVEEAAGQAPSKEGEADVTRSPDLLGNVERTVAHQPMRAHRSVVAARDRVYASYRLYYTARVREIEAACDAVVGEERQWSTSWKKLVARIEIV